MILLREGRVNKLEKNLMMSFMDGPLAMVSSVSAEKASQTPYLLEISLENTIGSCITLLWNTKFQREIKWNSVLCQRRKIFLRPRSKQRTTRQPNSTFLVILQQKIFYPALDNFLVNLIFTASNCQYFDKIISTNLTKR